MVVLPGQMSIFDMPKVFDPLKCYVSRGPMTSGGKRRIQTHFLKNESEKKEEE